MTAAEHAAIRAYPEISRLVELRVSGWQFVEIRSEAGHTASLHGVRTWPDGSAEALGVLGSTDAQAIRTNPNGEQVFFREGTLVEVIDALIGLPPPGSPGAPRLALPGRTPPLLWTP